MEVVGGGSVVEWGPGDEIAHPVGNHEFWQESVVAWWWDPVQAVGGYHRIGHEPHFRDGPQISLTHNVFTPDHIYKEHRVIPLREQDKLNNGFGGGDTCRFEFSDHAIWTFDQPDLSGEIHIRDLHTPIDAYPKSGAMHDEFVAHHMEVGSRFTGKVSVKGKTYDVSGPAYRDHGWGKRIWSGMVTHRWVSATLDDDTMVLLQTFLSPNNELARFGCIVRDNKLTLAKEVDIVAYIEPDGLTHRGGYATATLTTGEQLRLDMIPLTKGVVTWVHGIACLDTLCSVECNGVKGVADLEMTNNSLRGGYRPYLAINGIEKNGWHQMR